jgi:NTP pyrophosphatase (non-canonical NTP hydrolase)
MINYQQQKVLKSAIDNFGIDKQLDMVVEECAELIQAIQKYKRCRSEQILDTKVFEEVADVEIMLKQFRLMFGSMVFTRPDYQITGNEIIDICIDRKIDRLRNRVKNNNSEL